jgi:hypothetical protein
VVFENAGHETLPVDEVQTLIARFLAGEELADGRVTLAPMCFATLEEAVTAATPRR